MDVAAAYSAHAGEIYRLGLHVTHSTADAEDVMQEAFARLAKERAIENARAWLYKTATRIAIDVIRRRARPAPVYLNGAMAAAPDRELLERVLVAMKDLPERERAALVLREMHGWGLREIAEMLDLDAANLKVTLFRARERLRERLKGVLDDVR